MIDITPKLLAAKLAERAEEFVRLLLPNGTLENGEWCVGSPKGEPGNSCKIRVHGESAGKWKDFASDAPGGDLLDLVAAHREVSLGHAMREACEFLEIERPNSPPRRARQYDEPKPPDTARSLAKAPRVVAWLATRGIGPEVLTAYKIFADHDDTVIFPSLRDGKLLHLKMRSIGEKKFFSSKNTERCLFGWHALKPGIRSVILCEGEMDCLALAQYGFQSLSIPLGAGGGNKHDWIENEWENLERFDTIFIAMDPDRAGQIAVQELVERLGRHRCRVVALPKKDPNKCLMDGVPREDMVRAISAAKTLDPIELRNARDFTRKVIDRFHPTHKDVLGFYMPWIAVKDTFMFEWGATTIFAGYAGHGKSETVGQVIADAIRQGHKACVASLEFKSDKWMQRLVRQLTGNEQPSAAWIEKAMNWLGESLWAFDVYGGTKADRILEVFEYSYRRYGTRVFVIDNWSKLNIAEDDLTEQSRVISIITEFSVAHSIHLIVVNHLKKDEDDFHTGNKLRVKGSGSIVNLADNLWMVFRNRTKEDIFKDPAKLAKYEADPAEMERLRTRPDTILTCEKYRNGEEEPRIGLYFDRKSHCWVEDLGRVPYVYVKPPEERHDKVA